MPHATLVQTDDIGLGAIGEANALGDRVATEFVDSGNGFDIVLNRTSRIMSTNKEDLCFILIIFYFVN